MQKAAGKPLRRLRYPRGNLNAPKEILKKKPQADRDLIAHMREPISAYKPSQTGSKQFARREENSGAKQPVYIMHRFDILEDVRRKNYDIYGPSSGKIASPYLTRAGNLASDPMPSRVNEIIAMKKQVERSRPSRWMERKGIREQKFIDQFNELKMKVPIQYGTGTPPTFCREPLDLYALLVEALYQRWVQYHHARKALKSVARGLRVDLSGQTSASFALRVKYEQYLRDLEYLVEKRASQSLSLKVSSRLRGSKSTWKLKNESRIQKSKSSRRLCVTRKTNSFANSTHSQGYHHACASG